MRRLLAALLLLALTASAFGQSLLPPMPQDLNPASPLTRGLLGWWLVLPHLAAGPRWWSVVGPYHATLTNMGAGSGFQSTAFRGHYGQVRFDGTDDYADTGCATPCAFPDTTFTLAGWFWTTSATTAQWLFAQQATTGTQGGYVVRLTTSSTVEVRIQDSGTSRVVGRTSVTTLVAQTPYHVVAVFTTHTTTQSANDVTLYLNGVLDQTGRTDGTNPYFVCSGCPLTFGSAVAGGGNFLSGALTSVQLWNRGLSASEVSALYRAQAPTYGGLFDVPFVEAGPTVVIPPAARRRIITTQ